MACEVSVADRPAFRGRGRLCEFKADEKGAGDERDAASDARRAEQPGGTWQSRNNRTSRSETKEVFNGWQDCSLAKDCH
eukprot:2755366-Pyramimonas_sp.AAC.1